MSYFIQSQLANDMQIRDRITACAAGEGIPDAFEWVIARMWQFSAQDGWADAYRLAQERYNTDPQSYPAPGVDESAISDTQILAAVRAIRANETTQ